MLFKVVDLDKSHTAIKLNIRLFDVFRASPILIWDFLVFLR